MKSDYNRINDFTDLKVWQLAHQLKIEIYKFTETLPESEKFNRITQIKRSVSSISANIAEGFGRYHFQENIQFCRQARGSLDETRDHLITARDLEEASLEKCNELIDKCLNLKILLNGYIRSLNRSKLQITNNK